MKILFINRLMGVSWGGGENYDYHLARALDRRGHDVVMVTGQTPGTTLPSRSGLELIAVQTPNLRKQMYNLAGKVPIVPGLFAEADLRIFMERAKATILQTIAARSIDVVQILALPYLAAWLTPFSPAVMRFPGPPAWFQSELLRRLGRSPRFKMFTHGDAVDYFANQLQTPVREIAPGVDPQTFRLPSVEERRQARARLGLRDDDFVITSVGRLIEGKGHEFLLRALGRSTDPRLKCVLVGAGALRERFEAQAQQGSQAKRVIFAGERDRAGVAEVLWASDAFCLLSKYENYSNATLEAMACGLPVIASNVGGFPKQIREGENGHLIAYNDDEMLLTQIETLKAEPQRRVAMAGQALAFASQFSWDKAAAAAEEMYAEVTV